MDRLLTSLFRPGSPLFREARVCHEDPAPERPKAEPTPETPKKALGALRKNIEDRLLETQGDKEKIREMKISGYDLEFQAMRDAKERINNMQLDKRRKIGEILGNILDPEPKDAPRDDIHGNTRAALEELRKAAELHPISEGASYVTEHTGNLVENVKEALTGKNALASWGILAGGSALAIWALTSMKNGFWKFMAAIGAVGGSIGALHALGGSGKHEAELKAAQEKAKTATEKLKSADGSRPLESLASDQDGKNLNLLGIPVSFRGADSKKEPPYRLTINVNDKGPSFNVNGKEFGLNVMEGTKEVPFTGTVSKVSVNDKGGVTISTVSSGVTVKCYLDAKNLDTVLAGLDAGGDKVTVSPQFTIPLNETEGMMKSMAPGQLEGMGAKYQGGNKSANIMEWSPQLVFRNAADKPLATLPPVALNDFKGMEKTDKARQVITFKDDTGAERKVSFAFDDGEFDKKKTRELRIGIPGDGDAVTEYRIVGKSKDGKKTTNVSSLATKIERSPDGQMRIHGTYNMAPEGSRWPINIKGYGILTQQQLVNITDQLKGHAGDAEVEVVMLIDMKQFDTLNRGVAATAIAGASLADPGIFTKIDGDTWSAKKKLAFQKITPAP